MDRRGVIRSILAVSFIGPVTCFVTSLTAKEIESHFGAHFDGGLPATVSEPIDANGPFPRPAESFLREHARDYVVYWDFALQTPRYVSPRTRIRLAQGHMPRSSTVLLHNLEKIVRSFFDTNAEFFGVTSNELDVPRIERIHDSWLFSFRQTVRGVPIRGANIRVVIDPDTTLRSIKSFVLRDKPSPVESLDYPTALLRRLQETDGYTVSRVELQFAFRNQDPAAADPFWRFIALTPKDEPVEIFASYDGTRLLEERHFAFELGIVAGKVMGQYPDPDRNNPEFFFTVPTDIGDFPVEGLLMESSIDRTFTKERGPGVREEEIGTFEIVVDSVNSNVVTWKAISGTCGNEPVEVTLGDGAIRPVCPPDGKTIEQLQIAAEGECGLTGAPILTQKSSPQGDLLNFMINAEALRQPDTFGVLESARLMSFHHARGFLRHATDKTRGLGLDVDFGLLRIFIHVPEANRREYHPIDDGENPSFICISTELLSREGRAFQPLTPTILNHEVSHHIIFQLTGFRRSERFDCAPKDSLECPPLWPANLDLLREVAMVEGVTDALAAYYANEPKFGFVASSEGKIVPGALAYDISFNDPRIPNATRASVANLLFNLREEIMARSTPQNPAEHVAAQQLAERLVYFWLAKNRCANDDCRTFEFGPVVRHELLDVDGQLTGGESTLAINAVFNRLPDLTRAPFVRGDANQDTLVNLTDAIYLLDYLFRGKAPMRCFDSMDVDDEGSLNISDPIFLLNFLFRDGKIQIPPPFPDCGFDMTPDSHVCDRFYQCEGLDS